MDAANESSEETNPVEATLSSDKQSDEDTNPVEATVSSDKQLKCSICLDDFKEPKVLPCCHTFCKTCLERHHEKSKRKEELTCPECRAKHNVPEGGAGDFLSDFTIPTHSRQEEEETSNAPTHCQECESSDPVVAYCTDCQSVLCEDCTSGTHKKLRRFRDHNLSFLDDPDFSISESLKPMPVATINCASHSNRSLETYCMSCHKLVCCDCIVASHQGQFHKLRSIDAETIEKVQTELDSLVDDTRQKLVESEEHLVYIKHVGQVVASRRTELQSAIDQSFDRLAVALESRRTQLLKEAEGMFDQQDKELWAQNDRIETAKLGLTGALSFTERAMQCSSGMELLSVSAQAITRLNELKDVMWDSNAVEKVQFTSLNYKPTNQEYLQQIGDLDQSNDGYVTIDKEKLPESIELGVKTPLKLFTVDRSSRPVYLKPGDSSIRAKIFAGNEEKLMATVQAERNQDGSWTLPVTPVCGGLHTLEITITPNTDVPSMGVAAPVEQLRVSAPVEQFGVAAPVEQFGFAAPVEQLGLAAPVEQFGFAAPVEQLGLAAPVKRFEVDVTGIPDIGTPVCRGPDMTIYENFNPDDKQVGIITENDVEPGKLFVNWPSIGEDKTFSLRWGEDECYDVQLVVQYM